MPSTARCLQELPRTSQLLAKPEAWPDHEQARPGQPRARHPARHPYSCPLFALGLHHGRGSSTLVYLPPLRSDGRLQRWIHQGGEKRGGEKSDGVSSPPVGHTGTSSPWGHPHCRKVFTASHGACSASSLELDPAASKRLLTTLCVLLKTIIALLKVWGLGAHEPSSLCWQPHWGWRRGCWRTGKTYPCSNCRQTAPPQTPPRPQLCCQCEEKGGILLPAPLLTASSHRVLAVNRNGELGKIWVIFTFKFTNFL